MKNALLFFACAIFLVNCNSKEDKGKPEQDSLPECITKVLDAIEKKTMDNQPIKIEEYEYNGKRVFLAAADCCDQYDMVYDENCKSICSPSGGIHGEGDGRCKDFDQKAKLVKLIWQRKDQIEAK